MATKHTNHVKAKVWTPTMTMDYEGSPDDCIVMMFYALRSPERRTKCLAALEKADAKMAASEKGGAK